MNGLIDWVAEIVLSEHRVPTEVEGATQVETRCDTHTIVAGYIRTDELSLTSVRIITLSREAQNVTESLISKACHELNRVITSVVNVAIGRIHCARSESHIDLS